MLVTENAMMNELEEISLGLNEDELEVLLEVARGLKTGRDKYGPMAVGAAREWLKEADEEDRDWLVYRAAMVVKERRERKRGDKKD